MLEKLRKEGENTSWKNEYEVFSWWMEEKNIEGQYTLDDYEYE